MTTLQRILDAIRTSAIGHGVYRMKCLWHRLNASREARRDQAYIDSIDQRLEQLKHKKRITVMIFAMHPAYWHCDSLYKAMAAHERFDVSIVVCGEVQNGMGVMMKQMEMTCAYLDAKGYPYIRAYDHGRWADLKTLVNPDIVMYAKPYDGVMPRQYRMNNFLDRLFIYVPYGLSTVNGAELCNTRLHAMAWMKIYDSELQFSNSALSRGNSRITGSPVVDEFLAQRSCLDANPWKKMDDEGEGHHKRIIWAPHHSVGGGTLCYSNFLAVADDMVALAEEYADRIQVAFKPHPLLREVLYAHPQWGKERTDDYYRRWDTMVNTQLEQGQYAALFMPSDAMIHDCASFTAEYLITGNPVMYLAKGHHESTLNDFGRRAFDLHYKGQTMADIRLFIDDVVCGGNDPMRPERISFVNNHLLPRGGRSAAENIIAEILKFER